MLAQLNDLKSVSKTYYSERLIVMLTFHSQGGLDGQVYPFASCQQISSEVTGLYVRNKNNIQIGFTSGTSLTTVVYTGEILRYDGDKECLIIKWVTMIGDEDAQHSDIEVLFDSDRLDLTLETKKIRDYINSYEVMMS